jgi:hypothetical protein
MDKPGLLEIAAYGLFFSGTLVGPQFPLSRFRAFVHGHYLDERGHVVRESRFLKNKSLTIPHSSVKYHGKLSAVRGRRLLCRHPPVGHCLGVGQLLQFPRISCQFGFHEMNNIKSSFFLPFQALPFHWKVIWNTIWFRATMYRYCIVWLLTVRYPPFDIGIILCLVLLGGSCHSRWISLQWQGRKRRRPLGWYFAFAFS